jgi:hypothetical protein
VVSGHEKRNGKKHWNLKSSRDDEDEEEDELTDGEEGRSNEDEGE